MTQTAGRWLRRIGGFAALIVLVAVIGAATVWMKVCAFLDAVPEEEGRGVVVEIPHGSSGRDVAELMGREGIVTDAERFYLLLRYRDAVPGLRAGEFEFRTDWTPDQVVDALLHAPEVTYPLSVPEGLRFLEVAERVRDAGRGWSAERFLELVRDPEMLALAGVEAEDLEGYLFPETYRFSRDATERDVVVAMIRQFQANFGEAEAARAAELGMTRHEVVILASLVEKESAVPSERPLVSSVFHNRIDIGMKLECDPTIIYGIPDYDGIIHRSDIRNPHPWNTYVHAGLPKGPIANPGAESIRAVLHPADSEYLFFVSMNDGTHHFSATYGEHAKMVRKYQR